MVKGKTSGEKFSATKQHILIIELAPEMIEDFYKGRFAMEKHKVKNIIPEDSKLIKADIIKDDGGKLGLHFSTDLIDCDETRGITISYV